MKKYKFRLSAYTDAAGKTNPEAPRNGNEDNMFVCSDLLSKSRNQLFTVDKEEFLSKGGCLLAVADGMGGMNAGEVASEIAIRVVKESFSSDTIAPEVFENTRTRTRFLESVVLLADSAIKKHAAANPECEGMGSTIVLAWIYEGQITITWCGDSRAYIYRPAEGLRQVSKDHSYVQELVDAGKITMDEAFDHPYNNVITRSLGDVSHRAKPDSVTVPVYKGDIIMVNSDGLSGVLRDGEMEDIISDNRHSMSSCRTALWKAAEQAGWYDNVTAILCEITEGAEYSPASDNDGRKDLNDNYFNFRIRKKTLRWLLAVLGLVVVIVIGVISSQKVCMRSNESSEDALPSELEKELVIPSDTSSVKLTKGTSKGIMSKLRSMSMAKATESEVSVADSSKINRRHLTPADDDSDTLNSQIRQDSSNVAL